jgi:CRISPR-associated protein Cas2
VKPATAWLVCYDIAEPRRLARVWRAVREFGVPLQYSVFWARLDGIGLGEALGAIATRIDPRTDDVRLYPLPENVQITGLGRDVVSISVTRCCAAFGDRDGLDLTTLVFSLMRTGPPEPSLDTAAA